MRPRAAAIPPPALLKVLALLGACSLTPDTGTTDPPTDDDDSSPADDAPGVPLTCAAAPEVVAVRFHDSFEGPRDCPDPIACIQPYLSFLETDEVQQEVEPWLDCEAGFDDWVRIAADTRPPTWPTLAPQDGETLNDALLDETQTRWLFAADRFHSRPLDVRLVGEEQRTSGSGSEYLQRTLMLEDPLVGQIGALHLLPVEPKGPVPTVLILPGHQELAADHRDRRFGQYLPEHGLGALILDFRAWAMPHDHDATAAVLCGGMSMMMIRGYEALVAARYLRVAPETCGAPLGMLGHSGGSQTVNLLAWLDVNPVAALVSDLQSDYNGVEPHPGKGFAGAFSLDCETHPGLYGLADRINALEDSGRAVARVPYAYVQDGEEANGDPDPDDLRALDWFVPFFQQHLLEGR